MRYLNDLVVNGNTLIVIEHNLDIIAQAADWIIDKCIKNIKQQALQTHNCGIIIKSRIKKMAACSLIILTVLLYTVQKKYKCLFHWIGKMGLFIDPVFLPRNPERFNPVVPLLSDDCRMSGSYSGKHNGYDLFFTAV